MPQSSARYEFSGPCTRPAILRGPRPGGAAGHASCEGAFFTGAVGDYPPAVGEGDPQGGQACRRGGGQGALCGVVDWARVNGLVCG